MAAVSPMSMLAEEIRLQAAAAITQNADKLQVVEHPDERAPFPHDWLRVEFQNVDVTPADGESDFVVYSYDLHVGTVGDDLEAVGRTLNEWTRSIKLALVDRASDRSSLRTVPLPLSGLTLANSVVFEVEVGDDSPGTMEGDGWPRHSRTLTVRVRCYETATG